MIEFVDYNSMMKLRRAYNLGTRNEETRAAAVNGWFVIRGTTAQIKEGLVIQWIEKLIERLRGG